MKEELEKQLVEKYPKLFQEYGESPQKTCMAFGCEHGDGWFKILDDLCGYITSLTKRKLWLKTHRKSDDASRNYIEVKAPDVVFAQVKEKFGTLRIYWDSIPLENREYIESQLEEPADLETHLKMHYVNIHNAIDYAEYLSSITCEICGAPGKMSKGSWIRTICEKCSNEKIS